MSLVGVVVAPVARAAPSGGELLYVGGGNTISALSPNNGTVRFTKSPAIAARDWSRLYSTEATKAGTLLRTSDARTGKTIATRRLPSNLGVRAVSDDGSVAVLTTGSVTGANPYEPQPRAYTDLVVVRAGESKWRTYVVKGNVEPEAFSLSKKTLFVIEYTPPTEPARYRVARVDLTSQKSPATAEPVRSNEDELQEPMRGTARAQAMGPDGRRLYTLYTRDATATAPAEAFVHVLDLERERATCVDLPAEFATSPVGAVAVSPSGTRLYAVSPATGALAELDTAALKVTRTGHLPVASSALTVRATVADPNRLYVATGSAMTTIDLRTLTGGTPWVAADTVTGIEPGSNAGTLFVSLPDRVVVVDRDTGATRHEYPLAIAGRIDHVAPALRPIADEGGSVPCAC